MSNEDMRPIADHTEMLSFMLCKYIWCYQRDNPECSYTETLTALANVQYAIAQGVDQYLSDLRDICGSAALEAMEKVGCPDFVDFLEFTQEEFPEVPWEDDDEEDDEDDDY